MSTKFLLTEAFLILTISFHVGNSRTIGHGESELVLLPGTTSDECATKTSDENHLIQKIKVQGDINYLNKTINQLLEQLNIRKLEVPNPIPELRVVLSNLPDIISLKKSLNELESPTKKKECLDLLHHRTESYFDTMVGLVKDRFNLDMYLAQNALSRSRTRIDDVAEELRQNVHKNDDGRKCEESRKKFNEIKKELKSIESYLKDADQIIKNNYENFLKNNSLDLITSSAKIFCLEP